MARLSGNWLLPFLLATSLTAAAPSAIHSIDPALDSKPVSFESVKNHENREGHALQSDVSYANHVRYKKSQQSPTLLPLSPSIAFPFVQQLIQPDTYSVPGAPLYSKLDENLNSFKMLKLAERYFSKLKDLMPNLKPRVAVPASRVWRTIPSRSEITDDRAAFGIFTILQNLLTPDTFIFGPIFLVAFVFTLFTSIANFLFFGINPLGRRRVSRNLSIAEDLNEVFDFDLFLPAEQSKRLASLSARLDSMLDAYMTAYKDDTCMEKFSCQAGQMTSRIGKFTEPIITLLEPLVPAYMYKKLEAFKNGARIYGSADCSEMKCKLPFDG